MICDACCKSVSVVLGVEQAYTVERARRERASIRRTVLSLPTVRRAWTARSPTSRTERPNTSRRTAIRPRFTPSRRRRSARCPTRSAPAKYGKRDVEWVVRWYFRRRVGDVDHGGPSRGRGGNRRRGPTGTSGSALGRDRRWTGPTARPAPATAQATVRSIVIARARRRCEQGETARARVTVRRPPITGPSTRSRNCRASTLPSPPRCSGSSIRTGTWSSATGSGGRRGARR